MVSEVTGTPVVNKVRSDSEGNWQKNAMGNVVSEGDVNYGVEENAFLLIYTVKMAT